jgi:hypothetical protein
MAVIYGSPFFSSNYPKNLQLWFDSSDLSTLHNNVAGNSLTPLNGKVARWEDKSIYQRHLLQADSIYQPTLSGSMQNGFTGIVFNTNILTINTSYSVNGLQGMTVFSVVKTDPSLDNTTNMQAGTFGWGEIGGWGQVGQKVLDTRVNFRFGTGQFGNDNFYTRPSGLNRTATITTTDKNLTVDRLFINNTLVTTAINKLPTIANTSSSFQVGNLEGVYWSGVILEILIYSSFLSDIERNIILTYLNNKWRIY